MSLKNTDIKVYVHTNINAPQLANTWGALANVLDVCLITGYNCPAITSASVANSVLTITFSVNHNLLAGQVILISGANEAKYNREFRIANIPTLTSVQIDLDETFTEQLLGSISATIPPLGWVKEFSSGGKRAYRNAELEKTDRPFLRVVDEKDVVWDGSYAKYAKVGIVENMTNIDTMMGLQTPFDIAVPDKNWVGTGQGQDAYNGWAKWYYSRIMDVYVDNYYDSEGATPDNKMWCIIGSGDWFYVLPSQVVSIYPNIYFFGSLGGDQKLYGLSSSLHFDTAFNNRGTNNKTALSSGANSFLLHNEKSVGLRVFGMQSGANDGPGGSPLYYESISSNLVASDIYISQILNNYSFRALMPCLKWLMNPHDSAYELKTVEDVDSAYFLKTVCATTAPQAINGIVAFELYRGL